MSNSAEWKLERLRHVLDLSNTGTYLDEEAWDLEKVTEETRRLVGNMRSLGSQIIIPNDLMNIIYIGRLSWLSLFIYT
jgi:hypothetical protein